MEKIHHERFIHRITVAACDLRPRGLAPLPGRRVRFAVPRLVSAA
jgi:hypothetical protein